jgi:hypothetical protein
MNWQDFWASATAYVVGDGVMRLTVDGSYVWRCIVHPLLCLLMTSTTATGN